MIKQRNNDSDETCQREGGAGKKIREKGRQPKTKGENGYNGVNFKTILPCQF